MKRLTPDAGLVVAVTLLAVAYLWADSRLPSHSLGDPLGPRVFPALVGVGLLVSAVLLAFELRAERRARPVPPADADAGGEARVPTRVLVGAVAWLALYYACLEPVGYLLSTLAFLAGMLSYFHRGHWRANAVIAVAFTLVVDALFTYALGIPLAEGILHI